MLIRLFGVIEVARDGGAPVGVSAAKVRQLVAVLASNPGRVASLDVIVDSLWGDDSPASAANLVQGYVSDLRRIVGAEHIERRGGGYVLAVDPDDVDLARFERLSAEGRRLLEMDAARSASVLDDGIALVRGPLFADIAAHGPLLAVKARVDEAVIDVEELRADAELACGRHQGLVPRLEQLVTVHPYREAFWAQLALALYRSGRQAEALRRCQQLRVLLRDEIGISPSVRVVELEQRIARQDPSLDLGVTTATPPAPAADGSSQSVLVGRRNELERLRDRFERATRGAQQVIFVGGEPGIGKSSLAAGFGRRADAAGAVVLIGRCDEQINAPYLPFLGALGDHLRSRPADEIERLVEGRAAVARELLPFLPGAEPPRSLAHDGPGPSLLERFETLSLLLDRVRGDRPLVLVLEDLQWADSTTIGLLSFLISGRQLPASLILATCRSTEVAPDSRLADLLASLRSSPHAERMPLSGLSASEIELVIQSEDVPDLRAFAKWIHDETDGNPLFVRELVRHVGETGRRTGVPDGVIDVVSRRIRRLSEAAQTLLARAAVLGNEFPVALLRAMNGDLDGLGAICGEVERAGFLLPIDTPAGTTYRFSHATIRRAVTERTSAITREELHLRAADALDALDRFDDAPLAIAAHLRAAGSAVGRETAVAAYIAAASYADSRGAKAEAVQWYDLALGLLSADDERRRALRLTRFVAAQAAWHWHHDQRSIRTLREASGQRLG